MFLLLNLRFWIFFFCFVLWFVLGFFRLNLINILLFMVEVGRVVECFLFVLLCLCRLWCLGLCLKIFIKVFLSFDLWMFRFFLFLEFFIVKLFDFEFLELFKLLVWELLVLILFEFFWFFSMWLFFFYIKCFMFLFLEKVGESWVLEFW